MNVPVVGVLVALGLILVIWLAVVAPAERRYHERKLKILEERIERRKARLEEEASDARQGSRAAESASAMDHD